MTEEGGTRDGAILREELVVRGPLIAIRLLVGVEEGMGFRAGDAVLARTRATKVEANGCLEGGSSTIPIWRTTEAGDARLTTMEILTTSRRLPQEGDGQTERAGASLEDENVEMMTNTTVIRASPDVT